MRRLLWWDRTNNIAVYHMRTEHSIDWDNATCLAYATNYFERVFFWKVGTPVRKRIPSTFAANYQPLN